MDSGRIPVRRAGIAFGVANHGERTEGGSRRCVFFEVEQPQTAKSSALTQDATIPAPPGSSITTDIDVFAYLQKNGDASGDSGGNPGAAGPIPIKLWHGVPRDNYGKVLLAMPTSIDIGFGIQSTDPQPVVFGIAQGEFKVVAKGAASVAGLREDQTAVLASGPWGRIEATHLPRPQFETRPSPTHRFRLLGGAFPPKTERKIFFYDSNGLQIASCGDGLNSPGYTRSSFFTHGAPLDIARFEVQERPYEFVQFDRVSFDAPQFKAYSGQQGLDHALDSPIGKVVGVLKPTRDGPWSGTVLYSADGTRWIDPGPEFASYEYGNFDSWNNPLDERGSILFEPNHEFSSSTTPTSCEVYAVDSPDGPRKERLTSANELPFRAPVTMIPFKRTTRPYMRIEVRVGEGVWRTLDTIVEIDRLLSAAQAMPLGSRALEVFFDDDGGVRIWQGEPMPVRSKSTWHPGEQRVRAIAHMGDGTFADVNFNMAGYSGVDPNAKRYRGLEYTRQSNGVKIQSGFKTIDMKDISSIELQVQDLKAAISIPVHSPVD